MKKTRARQYRFLITMKIGQSKHSDTPFELADWSIKRQLQRRSRAAIRLPPELQERPRHDRAVECQVPLISGIFSGGMPVYSKSLSDSVRRLPFGGTLGDLLAQL